MRTRTRATLLALLLTLSCAWAARAEELEGFVPILGRDLASGGSHAALAEDFSALFVNPASLVAVPREIYAGRLGVKVSGPVFDILGALTGGAAIESALFDLLADSGYNLYAGVDIVGPLAVGFAGDGLAFGLFNNTRIILDAAGISSIGFTAAEDILLIGGYAFRIPLGGGHALDLGMAAKGFVRGAISQRLGAVELLGLLSDPSALLGLPFTLTTGVGIDAGIRWNWDEVFSAGLACRDLYSPALVTTYDNATAFIEDPSSANPVSESATLERDLSFGLAFRPQIRHLQRFVDAATFTLDYDDILDLFSALPTNPILNLGLGLEVQVLDILKVRAGICDALLNVGVGFDLSVFRMDVAVYGAELGLDPGNRSVYNLLTTFEFSY